jgi:hypothetical protein
VKEYDKDDSDMNTFDFGEKRISARAMYDRGVRLGSAYWITQKGGRTEQKKYLRLRANGSPWWSPK